MISIESGNWRCRRRTSRTATMANHCQRERRSRSSLPESWKKLAKVGFSPAAADRARKHATAKKPASRSSRSATWDICLYSAAEVGHTNASAPARKSADDQSQLSWELIHSHQHRMVLKKGSLRRGKEHGDCVTHESCWIFPAGTTEVKFKVFIVGINGKSLAVPESSPNKLLLVNDRDCGEIKASELQAQGNCKWRARRDSNSRPTAPEAAALSS